MNSLVYVEWYSLDSLLSVNTSAVVIQEPVYPSTQHEEAISGENVLKKWVRNLSWCNTHYLNEPSTNDPKFTECFGTKFHLDHIQGDSGTPSSGKYKHGPSPPISVTTSLPETPTCLHLTIKITNTTSAGHHQFRCNMQNLSADTA
ncbi:hypothetical protein VTO42DRAFT_4458 [Malbranchea cinnamomea]